MNSQFAKLRRAFSDFYSFFQLEYGKSLFLEVKDYISNLSDDKLNELVLKNVNYGSCGWGMNISAKNADTIIQHPIIDVRLLAYMFIIELFMDKGLRPPFHKHNHDFDKWLLYEIENGKEKGAVDRLFRNNYTKFISEYGELKFNRIVRKVNNSNSLPDFIKPTYAPSASSIKFFLNTNVRFAYLNKDEKFICSLLILHKWHLKHISEVFSYLNEYEVEQTSKAQQEIIEIHQ